MSSYFMMKKVQPIHKITYGSDMDSLSPLSNPQHFENEVISASFHNLKGEHMVHQNYRDENVPELFDSKSSFDFAPFRENLAKLGRSEFVKFRKDSVLKLDSFQQALNRTILIAQFFGVMPVLGIMENSASQVRFKWFSFRVIYTVLSLMGIFFMTALCVKRFYKYGKSFKETQCTVFYGCSFFRMLLFLLLARHWPALASKWEQMEIKLAHYGYPRYQHRKINIITSVFLFVAILEHLCSHLRVLRLAILCSLEDKMDGICTFFFNSFPHVYEYISCSLWNGIIIFFINMLCAFGWTYMDLFIILISVSLADRFKQINRCLQTVHGKSLSQEFWHQVRMDYNTLSNLTKTVDSCISKIVLLSYANNLYSICMQLLNNLHPPENTGQLLYVCLSFGYMIMRIVAVSICAASINEESNRPKSILYSVPNDGYSPNVERFLHQVTTDDIVLTGLNFFSVTRTLLVTVMGTIITYELVLVQFSGIHVDERDLATHSVVKRYCL